MVDFSFTCCKSSIYDFNHTLNAYLINEKNLEDTFGTWFKAQCVRRYQLIVMTAAV